MRYASGILPTDYGFTHQRADAVSGLDDYGARYYDPVAGQFTSADTTLAGGLNRYAYVAGDPETRTDPSGHIPGSPGHNFDLKLGYTQWLAQPAKVYAYQWAAPGTWQGFASYVGQAVLGTDTLSQSFHTLFQDPHASTGDKAKALGVGVFTAITDGVTLVSIVTAQPEGVEGARAADAAVLAAADLEHVAVATDATTVVGDAKDSETFFRTMSKEHFAQLQATGDVPPTRETFISPSLEYASKYQGVTVRFTVQGGTQDALANVGVRDASSIASAAYPDMPLVGSGWAKSSAFFKGEGGILNIGLGRGPALDIFNDQILDYEEVP